MFEQLPSKYIKQDGKFKVVYSVKITNTLYKFSTDEIDWYEAIGCSFERSVPPLEISGDGRVASWVEELPTLSSKAIKYSGSELNFILRNTVY